MLIRRAGRYLTLNAETEAEREALAGLAPSIAGLRLEVGAASADAISLRTVGRAVRPAGKADARPLNIAFDAQPLPLAVRAGIAPDKPALRRGALLYAAVIVAAYVVPSPMGSNVARLGVLLAGPVFLIIMGSPVSLVALRPSSSWRPSRR